MDLLLTALSGIAWTTVYIDSIRVGFMQRTYAMPIAALGLNIAWEWTYAFRDLTRDPQLQGWVNLIWALADVAILVTFFRYGRSEFPGFVSRPLFITGGVVIVITSFLIQWLFIAEFPVDMKAAQYSAFLQNLLMSGLFIAMFVARRGPRGQTLLIAVAKWIGTLAPTILFGFINNSLFVIGIGLLCSAFDLVYIGLLVWARRDPSAFPSVGFTLAARTSRRSS
jgi:hydrogenase-4 membrane subunit HyfE